MFHSIDPYKVVADVVVAAPLVAGESEAMCCIGVACCSSTEMDHGGQILLLLQRRRGKPPVCQRARDVSVEQGRGQLDRMARHDTAVETVEPARFQILPGAILNHHVIVDAVTLRLEERSVGDLVHADRARCRLVQPQGIPRQTPSPVRPRHRVAPTFNLGKRGQ